MTSQPLDVIVLRLGSAQKIAIGQDQRAREIIGEPDPREMPRFISRQRGIVGKPVDYIPQFEEGELGRSEEHTSELQSLMRISYAVFCLQQKRKLNKTSL